MNADLSVKFNNKYHIELIDSITGSIKQSGDFHNIIVKRFFNLLTGTAISASEGSTSGNKVGLNTFLAIGSGTTAPDFNDDSLSKEIGYVKRDSSSFEWIDDYTGRCTSTYTFPATSEYVGTITEVGLYYATGGAKNTAAFGTHALLTDSEGQSISFIKTDIDILKVSVTVEMSVASISTSFKIFKKPFLIPNVLRGIESSDRGSYGSLYGNINLCRYYFNLETWQPYKIGSSFQGNSIDKVLSTSIVAKNNIAATNECYVKWPVVRLLATEVTSERYYKGIAIPGIGYWALPNEDIFPAYTIAGINVGTGDGQTMQFANPLCYFKKDTDKVYKNGVQLTRGVDYTLSNIANSKCLPEVAELIPPVNVDSKRAKVTTLGNIPLILPTSCKYATIDGYDFSTTFTASYPLYIEYEEEVTLNCLKCTGSLKSFNGTNGFNSIPTGSMFYLDYSTDGVTYIEAASVATVDSDAAFTMDFDDITAKYWRVRTNASGEIGIYETTYGAEMPYMTLNRKHPYITFAEAPAEGDVITMDVDMDVIMKNNNFVVDVGCRIDFSL